MELREYQKQILNKVRESYRQGYKAPCLVLPCGGGKSVLAAEVAKLATHKGNRVLFLVHRKELCEQIENTFNWWGVDMTLCTVGMVQTISRRVAKIEPPKLIITDENHHSPSKTYRKIYESFPDAQILGVTATPTRLDGSGLADVNDVLVEGVSAKWLIENGYLAQYEYYAPPTVSTKNMRKRAGDFEVNPEDYADIYGDVIGHYRKFADGKQTIVYCASVDLSMQTAEEFNKAGIPAAHLDGDTPKNERSEIIRRYRAGDIKILTNCEILGEGLDVQGCECCILLRPTESLSLHIQQSMRCMRPAPGKTAIIIDHVGNVFRHGFPDDDREWTLEGKKRTKKTENTVMVKQCPQCYFTYSVERICPNCGWQVQRTESEIKHDKEIELIKLDADKKQRIRESAGSKKRIDDCKTFQECVEWCKLNNKKTGYAYFHWKNRGYNIKFGG